MHFRFLFCLQEKEHAEAFANFEKNEQAKLRQNERGMNYIFSVVSSQPHIPYFSPIQTLTVLPDVLQEKHFCGGGGWNGE